MCGVSRNLMAQAFWNMKNHMGEAILKDRALDGN